MASTLCGSDASTQAEGSTVKNKDHVFDLTHWRLMDATGSPAPFFQRSLAHACTKHKQLRIFT
jgi:hypothetical protein